jgi:surface antigen
MIMQKPIKTVNLIGASVFLIAASFTVQSFDLHFLKHSPARHFTKQDWDIAKTAIRDLLNNHQLGETVSWHNPDSGNSGKLETLKVDESSGSLCKTVQIRNRAKKQEGKASFVFCKQPDGKWKVKSL